MGSCSAACRAGRGLLRTVLEAQETRGLTRSDDISRLLPSEAANMARGRRVRQSKLLFFAKVRMIPLEQGRAARSVSWTLRSPMQVCEERTGLMSPCLPAGGREGSADI